MCADTRMADLRMKVTRLVTLPAVARLPEPVVGGGMEIHSVGVVAVLLETDAGLIGEGLVFALNGRGLRILEESIRMLEPLVIGLDPAFSGAFSAQAQGQIGFFGHKSPLVMAIAGIDAALWDLRAKAAGLPIHRLIGAVRDRVPVYWSGGLWLSQSIDALQEEAALRLRQGYRAMKIRLRDGDLDETVRRVHAVREAVGPQTALMVDANQTLTVREAIRMTHALHDAGLDLTWFEEPVPYYDHAAEAEIAAASPIPIASGESEFLTRGMHEMLRAKAAHVLMPDLQRMGGPTEYLSAAHVARQFGVPVSSHLFTEMSLGLLAAIENATWLEHMPWFDSFYLDHIEVADGHALASTRPGHGFRLDIPALQRLKPA